MTDAENEQCCDLWWSGTRILNSAVFQLINHGAKITIAPFKFCPWCGEAVTITPPPALQSSTP